MNVYYCCNCHASIDYESLEFDEATDSFQATCPSCGDVIREADLGRGPRSLATLHAHVPRGCHVTRSPEWVRYSARHFSAKGFFAFLLIAILWNGIVSFFSLAIFTQIYSQLVGPLPEWLGMEPPRQPVHLVHLLVVLPLLFAHYLGIKVIVLTLLKGFGRTDVELSQHEGWVNTRLGPLRWRRHFNRDDAKTVRFARNSYRDRLLLIQADRPIRVGVLLESRGRLWLREALYQELIGKPPS